MQNKEVNRKTLKGKIVSDKMQQTVVVLVTTRKKHPVYGKMITRTKRFKAHNETDAKLGSDVVIRECRPYSKHVNWEVLSSDVGNGK